MYSLSNDIGGLSSTYALINHTHSGYASTADLASKFDSANITYSATDLTAGSSTLTTGKYYFKYD